MLKTAKCTCCGREPTPAKDKHGVDVRLFPKEFKTAVRNAEKYSAPKRIVPEWESGGPGQASTQPVEVADADG